MLIQKTYTLNLLIFMVQSHLKYQHTLWHILTFLLEMATQQFQNTISTETNFHKLVEMCLMCARHYGLYIRCSMHRRCLTKHFKYLQPKGTNLEIFTIRNKFLCAFVSTYFLFFSDTHLTHIPLQKKYYGAKSILNTFWGNS